jgi:MFS family permease
LEILSVSTSLERPDPYAALKDRNYATYAAGLFLSNLGRQMLTVGIGWDIYEKTQSTLALGAVGLAQVLPVILLTLPAGHIVDQNDRKKVLRAAQLVNMLATGGLLLISFLHHNSVHASSGLGWLFSPVGGMYLCLMIAGIGRSFHSPSNAAMVPSMVGKELFTNAVTWNSILYQTTCVLGPAVGGLLIAVYKSAFPVYLADFLGCFIFWLSLSRIQSYQQRLSIKEPMTLKSLVSGISFVWKTKIILAAITLDMFAVLFGGAVALLPVYAKDILHVGPDGLGWLQAAPSVGAILMAAVMARMGPLRNAGRWLTIMVMGFGAATIVFGLSRNLYLSLAMLVLTGMCDNISVIVRTSLVQLRTPDALRGRVSSINYVFIGASNELGGFESGLVASGFGPVFSVVFGGFATIATVILTMLIWPDLRRLDRLLPEENEIPVFSEDTAEQVEEAKLAHQES